MTSEGTNGVVRWSKEAEICVLGALFLRPEMLPEIQALLGPDDFYAEAHRVIYQAMLDLQEQRRPVDPVIMINILRETDRIDLAGGPEYLASVCESVPTAANAIHYASLVLDFAIKRRSELILHEALEQVRSSPAGQAAEQVQQAQASLYGVIEARADSQPEQVREGLKSLFGGLEERMRAGKKIAGMATGFADLDTRLSGLQRKQMVVVAARPSMGKSSLVKGMALNLALGGNGVVVFPLEDGRERFLSRSISELSGVAASKIRDGRLSDEDFQDLFRVADDLSKTSLFIDDPARLTPSVVRNRIMNLKRKNPITVAMVDYLQKMTPPRHYPSQERELSEISGELKAIAKELDICMVVVSQMNRESSKKTNKRPQLDELRGSGAIEQDADAVLLIYRDDYYHQNSKEPGIAEVIVAKGRDAETGTVKLAWDPACVRFRNLEYRGGDRR